VYEPAANYFAAKIDSRIYDITGDVTEQGKRELWSEYELGFSFRDGVVKECIMFCRFWKSSQQHPRKSAADPLIETIPSIILQAFRQFGDRAHRINRQKWDNPKFCPIHCGFPGLFYLFPLAK